MPIDYQQIFTRIKEIGAGARERKKTLEERRVRARDLLAAYASELDVLLFGQFCAPRPPIELAAEPEPAVSGVQLTPVS